MVFCKRTLFQNIYYNSTISLSVVKLDEQKCNYIQGDRSFEGICGAYANVTFLQKWSIDHVDDTVGAFHIRTEHRNSQSLPMDHINYKKENNYQLLFKKKNVAFYVV